MNKNTQTEMGEKISSERQRVLLGFGEPRTLAEREFQIQYAEHCGYAGPMTFPKYPIEGDYEGAILAQQSITEV